MTTAAPVSPPGFINPDSDLNDSVLSDIDMEIAPDAGAAPNLFPERSGSKPGGSGSSGAFNKSGNKAYGAKDDKSPVNEPPPADDKFRPSLRMVMAISTGAVVLLVAVAVLLVSNLITTAAVQDLGKSMSSSLAKAAANDAEVYFEKHVAILKSASAALKVPSSMLPGDLGTGTERATFLESMCQSFKALQATVGYSLGTLGVLYTDCGLTGVLPYFLNSPPVLSCMIRQPLGGPTAPQTNTVLYYNLPAMTLNTDPSITTLSDQGTDPACSKTLGIVSGVAKKNVSTPFFSAAVSYKDPTGKHRATLSFPLMMAALNSSNFFMGVLATSVSVEILSDLLKNLDKTSNAQIFAIDASLQVMGATTKAQPFKRYDQDKNLPFPNGCLSSNDVVPEITTTTIICPYTAKDTRIGYAPLNYVGNNNDKLLNVRQFTLESIDIDGTPFFVTSAPVASSARLFSLNIVFFLPEDDLLGDIEQGRNIAIAIAVAVLICAVVLAVVIVFKILKPINVVLERMEDAAKLNMHEGDGGANDAEGMSSVSEIYELQMKFAGLWVALQSFSSYVPKEVVKDLIASGELCKIGMSKKNISLIATDIQAFSSISERCDPDALSRTMTIYFEQICSRCVDCVGGVVISFIGDAILAAWNATSCVVFNHEAKAICSALMIQHACSTDPIRSAFDDLGEAIVTRVGVNTGQCSCGNLGSQHRMSFDVIGANVNLCFRMEGQNKAFGTRVMTNGDMIAKVDNLIVSRFLIPVAVVGYEAATNVFEVVGLRPKLTPKDVLDAKEESVSMSVISVRSRGTAASGMSGEGRGPVLSTRAGANVTAQRVLEACLGFKTQSVQASEIEQRFSAEYSRCAQQFADGDPKSCLDDLKLLRKKYPAFFAEDTTELRELIGENRCDSTLMRADVAAGVLEKQCNIALAAIADGSAATRGGPLMMRAETK